MGGVETVDGYHVAGWSDANLAFVAVSDMDEKTLEEFVATFRQARKPAEERRLQPLTTNANRVDEATDFSPLHKQQRQNSAKPIFRDLVRSGFVRASSQ